MYPPYPKFDPSPDYVWNPPDMPPPKDKSFYLILFINDKQMGIKGHAIVYRRKTLDMLFDLMNDIDDVYNHSMEQNNNDIMYMVEQTKDINVYYKVIYTHKFQEIIDLIDPEKYIIKFAWHDIPNTNPPGPPYPHNYPPPYPHKNNRQILNVDEIIWHLGKE